jgi:hypothetical protein
MIHTRFGSIYAFVHGQLLLEQLKELLLNGNCRNGTGNNFRVTITAVTSANTIPLLINQVPVTEHNQVT